MFTALVGSMVLAIAAAPEIKLEAGTVLNYRGSFQPAGENPAADARKTFDLMIGITQRDAKAGQAFWLINERGRGAWPWSQRFAALAIDDRGQTSGRSPALVYDLGDSKTIVAFSFPLFTAEQPLRPGLTWRDGQLDYSVEKSARRQDRDAWQIAVRSAFGPVRTLWRDAELPLVLAASERVIIGRGDEYKLEYELASVEMLSGDVRQQLIKASDAVKDLVAALRIPADQDEVQFSAEQLKLLEQNFPKVASATAGTVLEKLVSSAQSDVRVQTGRATAVGELVKEALGKKIEAFSATTTDGEQVTEKDLAGQVTVLHFWEYRDEPLKEPYGQVGYLDFLFHQRKSGGLKVYGVAVDGRLADDETLPAARRGAKKLKEFMNLSYPVLLDRGGLLRQLGDPRVLGAGLPLFVVVGGDANVTHVHVGMYEVTREQGLKELNDAVGAALKGK